MTQLEYISSVASSAFSFVIVVMLFSAVVAQKRRTKRIFFFEHIACAAVLSAVLDIGFSSLIYFSEGAPTEVQIFFMYVCRLAEVWFISYAGAFWYLYSALICNLPRPVTQTGKMLFYLPIELYGLILVTTPWTHIVFSFGSKGNLVQGPLYMLAFAMPITYTLTSSIMALIKGIRRKYDIKRELYFMSAAIVVPPIITGILEYFYRGIPFVQMGATLSLLFVFFRVLNTRIYMDQLTNMDNRNKMVSRLEEEIQRVKKGNVKTTLTLLLFDIDYFRELNMLFGHKEGDKLLIQVSTILKKACAERGNFIVGRYGADEFIVIGQTENPDQITEFCAMIDEQIKPINTETGKEYTVSLSAGFAVYKDSYKDVQDFITVAEESLEKMQNLKKRLK